MEPPLSRARPRGRQRTLALTIAVLVAVAGMQVVADATGSRFFFGSADRLGLARPAVAIAAHPGGKGYWLAAADGGVFAYGEIGFHGSAVGASRNGDVVDIAAHPSGDGYWLAAADGGVFAYGAARFHGSTAGAAWSPVTAIVAHPSGEGYWLVAEDGGVRAFGSAPDVGSAAGRPHRYVAAAATAQGRGLWVAGEDGAVTALGDAPALGSVAGARLAAPIVGMAATAAGDGYWLAGADGGVFGFGAARFHGSAANVDFGAPVAGIAASPDVDGYWLTAEDGQVLTFVDEAHAGADGGEQAVDGAGSAPPSTSTTTVPPPGDPSDPGSGGAGGGSTEPPPAERPEPDPEPDEEEPPLSPDEGIDEPLPDPEPVPEDPDVGPDGDAHVAPASIDPTGQSDVTRQLLGFFESVPDGSTITFPAGAQYRIEGSLRIIDRNDLVFDGNGARFFATSPGEQARRHWWFDGGSNITIRNLVVEGSNPYAGQHDLAYQEAREFQHGFAFGGTVGVELDRVKVTDVWGDFVYLGKATAGADKNRRAARVHVHDSHFERNGRQGVAITAADDVLIERNYIGETRRATFDLEPPTATWRVRNVRILHNRIGDGRLLFVASKGKGTVEDVLVQGNELSGRPISVVVESPADGPRRSGWRFLDNRTNSQFGSPQRAAMRFEDVDDIEVRGNRQPLQKNRDMYLVRGIRSCGISVSDNDVGPYASGQVLIEPYRCG